MGMRLMPPKERSGQDDEELISFLLNGPWARCGTTCGLEGCVAAEQQINERAI